MRKVKITDGRINDRDGSVKVRDSDGWIYMVISVSDYKLFDARNEVLSDELTKKRKVMLRCVWSGYAFAASYNNVCKVLGKERDK